MAVMTRRSVRTARAVLAAAMLAAPAPLLAQDGPVAFTLGGAVVGPLSDSADRFTTGPGIAAGAWWNLTEQSIVRIDGVWSRLGSSDDWPAPPLDVQARANARFQFASAAFMFQGPPARVRAYILAGFGLYRRTVRVSASGGPSAGVCDPYWFVCESGPVSAGRLAGSRSSTDLGLNVGAGVRAGRCFAEIRYHAMWGPRFETPDGTARATGRFLPLTVGVMF